MSDVYVCLWRHFLQRSDKEMTVVYTHPDCRWSSMLLQWMLENVPQSKQEQISIKVVSKDTDVTHVPSMQGCIGYEQCKNLLRAYCVQEEEKPSAPAIVSRDMSQYHNQLKTDDSLDEKYNNLVAQRAKVP